MEIMKIKYYMAAISTVILFFITTPIQATENQSTPRPETPPGRDAPLPDQAPGQDIANLPVDLLIRNPLEGNLL